MHQHFWKRWNLEFLHTLQQRSKWTDPSTPIKVGSVVLIKDDSSPPLHWRVGRVFETHPGSDNVVRVVTLKTALGTLKRPVAGATTTSSVGLLVPYFHTTLPGHQTIIQHAAQTALPIQLNDLVHTTFAQQTLPCD
ncbi:hypothetical protein NQ318_021287 [Aromia moschata]|uniref:DUF5641 domain-containing protein n=1 Tax=Aromia moschata TaxID=1265417 RepID=A0AAV8ZCK4_9CUCU|nr:hypothetical protein NQ318_021287 [Aromia moschata]